ncbi:MAG: hypothetical protein Q9217_000176 [Psora testacea]
MDNIFKEEYLSYEWNDFINTAYPTSYDDATLFPSLDYLLDQDPPELGLQRTTFPQDPQPEHAHGDRISTPVTDQAHLEGPLGDQCSGVKAGGTRSEYEEIKALYELNSTTLILLTLLKTNGPNESTPRSFAPLFPSDEINAERFDGASQSPMGGENPHNSAPKDIRCIEPGRELGYEQECWRRA